MSAVADPPSPPAEPPSAERPPGPLRRPWAPSSRVYTAGPGGGGAPASSPEGTGASTTSRGARLEAEERAARTERRRSSDGAGVRDEPSRITTALL